MSITIVGLGPGRIEDITLAVWRRLEGADEVYLRTNQHPLVNELPKKPTYHSFDAWYDTATSFDDLYQRIAQEIVRLGQRPEGVIYAVPGHPMVGERTTQLILAAAKTADVSVQVLGGLSFIEASLQALQLDGMNGLQIYDALDITQLYHPPINPDFPTLIGQLYSRDVAAQVKLALMNLYPDETTVTLLHGAGTPNEKRESVPLFEMDHSTDIAHLTSLYVPALPYLASFEALQNVMAHLRSEVGCPWDQEQTHESLRPQLLEEVYEVLEAIDNGDMNALKEELGDLLMHVIFQGQIAVEEGEFYFTETLHHIIAKLIRRHPHVWGDVAVAGADDVAANWEAIKAQEEADKQAAGKTARQSQLDGVPLSLPALVHAFRLQERAAAVGFDWPTVEPVIEKVFEEIEEIKAEPISAEFGDLLFAVVNWARWQGIDPESALRETNARFRRRFQHIEGRAKAQARTLQDMTLAELDAFWNEAKQLGL